MKNLNQDVLRTVTLLLSQIDNAIAIPSEALIPQMEGEIVYVYQNGKASSVKVGTGLRTELQNSDR